MALPVAEIAVGGVAGYEAEERGLIGFGTPAKAATTIALISFGALVFVLARGGGLKAGALKAVEFVVIVALAVIPLNYLVRTNALQRTGSPFWAGLAHDV